MGVAALLLPLLPGLGATINGATAWVTVGTLSFQPSEVLLSCLYETRFGLTRKDLVEWAKQRFEVPITVFQLPAA